MALIYGCSQHRAQHPEESDKYLHEGLDEEWDGLYPSVQVRCCNKWPSHPSRAYAQEELVSLHEDCWSEDLLQGDTFSRQCRVQAPSIYDDVIHTWPLGSPGKGTE